MSNFSERDLWQLVYSGEAVDTSRSNLAWASVTIVQCELSVLWVTVYTVFTLQCIYYGYRIALLVMLEKQM